jgi:hypothetical protein
LDICDIIHSLVQKQYYRYNNMKNPPGIWKWVVRFMLWLHIQATHWIREWLGPRVGQKTVEKRTKLLPSPEEMHWSSYIQPVTLPSVTTWLLIGGMNGTCLRHFICWYYLHEGVHLKDNSAGETLMLCLYRDLILLNEIWSFCG